MSAIFKAGFTFKATASYPEVTFGSVQGPLRPKDEVKVTADADERQLILQDRNTRLVSVDREAKEGDNCCDRLPRGFLRQAL